MGDEHFQIKLFWGYIWSEVDFELFNECAREWQPFGVEGEEE